MVWAPVRKPFLVREGNRNDIEEAADAFAVGVKRVSALSSEHVPSSDQGFQTEAIVKWFSLVKGFGFVAPADGSSDAFMHSSVASRAGLRDVPEGTKMLVQITDGPKGRQVASIIQVLGVAEVPRSTPTGGGSPAPTGPETEMTG